MWEKEQQAYEAEKRRVEAAAEFAAEQECERSGCVGWWRDDFLACFQALMFSCHADLKTLSLLSEEEQRKYRERQSVSWLCERGRGLGRAGCCCMPSPLLTPSFPHVWLVGKT